MLLAFPNRPPMSSSGQPETKCRITYQGQNIGFKRRKHISPTKTSRRVGNGTCRRSHFTSLFSLSGKPILQKSQSPHGCVSGMPRACFHFSLARFVLSRLGYLSATQPKQVLMLSMCELPLPSCVNKYTGNFT